MLCESKVRYPGTLSAWWKLSASHSFIVRCFSSLSSAQSFLSWAVHLMTAKSHLLGTIWVEQNNNSNTAQHAEEEEQGFVCLSCNEWRNKPQGVKMIHPQSHT